MMGIDAALAIMMVYLATSWNTNLVLRFNNQ